MDNKIRIGLFGAPNSGKSTLFNALMNQPIAIISDKPQTTNRITQGLLNIGDFHITLTDTPGISFIKNTGLRGVLNNLSWQEINNNDYNFFLVPANKCTIPQEFIDKCEKFVVIITKVDMVNKKKIPSIIEKIQDLYNPHDILCVSAKYDKGVDYICNYFLSLPHRINKSEKELFLISETNYLDKAEFIEQFVMDEPTQLALDTTREALFNILDREVPYYIEVENSQWKEAPKGIHLEQTIMVPNVHYRIILYSKQNLERIKHQIQDKLQILLNKAIFVKFKVKIKK